MKRPRSKVAVSGFLGIGIGNGKRARGYLTIFLLP